MTTPRLGFCNDACRISACLFLIAVTVYFAHFGHSEMYGLYEDDYWAIAPFLEKPLPSVSELFRFHFTHWYTGRPLNYFLPAALAITGSALGGLEGVYALSAAWLTLNCSLVFLIARRIFTDRAALTAAISYALFPADSTRILLVHAAHVQGSMTFLFCGVWLWLRGGRARGASYPIAALSLLSYETAFLGFLAVPLLLNADRRSFLKTWAKHVLACCAILVAVSIVRLETQDSRVAATLGDPATALFRSATSLYIGPTSDMRVIARSVIEGFLRMSAMPFWTAIIISVGFIVLWSAITDRPVRINRTGPIWPTWLDRARYADGSTPWWYFTFAALITWCGSYALSITDYQYPPTCALGRLTSVHTAAAWPASLALASLVAGILRQQRLKLSYLLPVVLAAILTLELSFHQWLQREFAFAWRVQQDFWRQVVTLTPEIGRGWSVIVTGPPAEGSPVILSNSWADILVLRQIVGWGSAPAPTLVQNDPAGVNFAHIGNIQVEFRKSAGHIEWRPEFWGNAFIPIDLSRLVLIHSNYGQLSRIATLETDAGLLVPTSPAPADTAKAPSDTPLRRLLIDHQLRR